MANARACGRERTAASGWVVGVSLLFGCGAWGLADTAAAQGPEPVSARQLHQCAACHGDDGVSRAEMFPDLAGQQKDYIAAQLTAFRGHTRSDRNAKTYMWGMATGLSDGTVQALAAYYSAKPSAGATAGATRDIATGKAIFETGVAAHAVLACVSCHGAHAEGNGVIPRLAGQHGDYLRIQLGAYASGDRDNATMHLIAKGMTPKEIKAVATYLSSL